MDEILIKPDPDSFKPHEQFDLNGTNSDDDIMEDDDSRELGLAIEENIRDHNTELIISSNSIDIKQEDILDLGSDIILPQISQNQTVSSPKPKKDIKTKRELEEEEREKMQ